MLGLKCLPRWLETYSEYWILRYWEDRWCPWSSFVYLGRCGEDRLCGCNKKMCCGKRIVDRCFKVEIASKSWQATALWLWFLSCCWPSELALCLSDTAKVCCRCEERHVFVGDSWPPKSSNSRWMSRLPLMVKVLAKDFMLLTSGSILCLWHLQRMFWRRVSLCLLDDVGTLVFFRNNGHGVSFWSSLEFGL